MSHYSCFVLIPEKGDVETEVNRLMEPYHEETNERGGFWDWFQIGGRWSGALDGYNPDEDPRNIKTCDLCEGTGTRLDWPANTTADWITQCNGCNGCKGTGKQVVWPTSFATHDG